MDTSKLDINGKASAKRKWASRLGWVAVGSFLAYGAVITGINSYVYLTMEDQTKFEVIELMTPYLKDMWIWIIVGFFSALSLTIFEFLNNFFKK